MNAMIKLRLRECVPGTLLQSLDHQERRNSPVSVKLQVREFGSLSETITNRQVIIIYEIIRAKKAVTDFLG
jgi:hypothetical protein